MEFLKELFANGALTYEQFLKAVNDKGLKLADLSTGEYVDKKKHNDELTEKDTAVKDLKDAIEQRDKDLADIKKQLEDAGIDKGKLTDVSKQLADLQVKYDTDTKTYQEKLSKQAYEFAVKDFANGKKFTSNAAKRDFINSLTSADLKMDKGSILGAEDFTTKYAAENEDAFVKENPKPEEPVPPAPPAPRFGAPTGAAPVPSNPFNFHFAGVRSQRKD